MTFFLPSSSWLRKLPIIANTTQPNKQLYRPQCYILKKKADAIWHDGHPFPRDVDYMVADTLESLRPKLTIFTNLEEAVQNLEKLNKEHQEQIGNCSSFSLFSLALALSVLHEYFFPGKHSKNS